MSGVKFWRSFSVQALRSRRKANLASRVAWLALCLSALGACISIAVATLWLSSLEMDARRAQLDSDITKFSAIIVSSLQQYDFARLADLGQVFADENPLIKDFEIWHHDGLRMMQYGESMPSMRSLTDTSDIYQHQVMSPDNSVALGTLRYRTVDIRWLGLNNYWMATALTIALSCLLTALMMQRLLTRYLVEPLSQLTAHVKHFTLDQPHLAPLPYGAREIKQLCTSFGQMADRVVNQATTDPVTGLRNRIYLEGCIRSAEQASEKPCAVMLLDLDHFKRINDNFGHPTGDFLLRSISKRISAILLPNTELVRMGGDEFAIWFSGEAVTAAPQKLETLIYGTMQSPFTLGEGRVTQARLSGGFACYPKDVASPGDLLTAADLALYKTKELRTANITYYTQDLYEESSEWMAISNLLRHQLNRDTLKFHFQQIVHSGDRSVWGHEMLLRLIAEDGKVYNTETVIQVAGQMGLMGIIVEKTIASAIDALQNTIHQGAVTINMSPEQIALLTPDQIAKLMAPVNPELRQRLVIELTEQSLLDSIDVLSPVTQLHKLGYRIALDDFGSGYSAMSCLSSFPLSIVKLDKSLTQDLLVKSNRELLSGITYISEKMGFSVIAEGIETQEQFEMVSDLGCDLAQGYFFGKPVDLSGELPFGEVQPAMGSS